MSEVPSAGDGICRLEDIANPGSRGLTVILAGQLQDIFIVRQADRVYGYRNRCPHTGAPLDWTPDRFLDLDGKYIQCAMHAALFRRYSATNGNNAILPSLYLLEGGLPAMADRPLFFGSPLVMVEKGAWLVAGMGR